MRILDGFHFLLQQCTARGRRQKIEIGNIFIRLGDRVYIALDQRKEVEQIERLRGDERNSHPRDGNEDEVDVELDVLENEKKERSDQVGKIWLRCCQASQGSACQSRLFDPSCVPLCVANQAGDESAYFVSCKL